MFVARIAAITAAVLLVIWMLMGKDPEPEITADIRLQAPAAVQKVQAEWIEGELMNREVRVSGSTQANRVVQLRAEIKAPVIEIPVKRGTRVKAGDIIMKLDSRDWPAKLAEANALLQQRQLEHKSAQKLHDKGLLSDVQLATANTALANAKAAVSSAKKNLAATIIRAPFDGTIDQRFVELGDLVREGDALLTLLDMSPMLVIGQLAERHVSEVSIGDIAYATLTDGTRIDGKIRHVAAQANDKTRTYAIEMEVINSVVPLSSGLTASLFIPQPPVNAYFVSPALLMLNDSGQMSLKSLSSDNRVVLTPVDLLKASDNGIWVYGPSDTLNLITVGHGFVEEEQVVQPIYASSNNGE